MTKAEWQQLKRGDVIRNLGSGEAYLIERTESFDGYYVVKSLVAYNYSEWEKVDYD